MIKQSILRNRFIILACILVFIAGIPLGYLSYYEIKEKIMPVLKQLVSEISDKSQLETVASIFFNNYKVAVLLTVLGTLFLPSLLILFANGFIMGFVIKLLEEKNLGVLFFLQGITLHGLFELPALFISSAIGIRIGLSFFTLDNKKRIKQTNESIREAIKVHFLIVLPFLIIAALIEVFVSAALVMK